MREIRSREDWERQCLALPAPHLLQGWDWGALKERWGWRATRLAWTGTPPEGPPMGLAQILVRRLGRSPFRMGYLPKGPLLAEPERIEHWSWLLDGLETWAQARRLTFLKMDADLPGTASELAAAWRARGWRPSEEQIQFPNTMVSSLAGGEQAVLAGMKPKTRYNIRLAERRGVVVRRGGLAELEPFLDLYERTGRRAGFGLRSRDYYRDLVASYLQRDEACVILAEKDGRALAGVVPVAYGPTTWYLYGASSDEGRADMPAYLAQWESLRWAIERGCGRYDWWGGPARLDESDPLWGIYRFKAGFGAELVEQQGAWDLPVSRAGYALYRRLAALRAAGIRRLAGG